MRPYYDEGGVTIYHADCREVDEWLSADVLVTDPPYGMALSSGWGGTFGDLAIVGDSSPAARDMALAAWGDRPALVFGRWSVPRPTATRALLTWEKSENTGMGDLALPWKPNTEEIYVLGSGFIGRRNGSVLRFPAPAQSALQGRLHPTEKPVGLLRALIEKCPAGIIADPFAGSGATLVAARQLGRRAIGIEIEEKYCEVAARRLAQAALPLWGEP